MSIVVKLIGEIIRILVDMVVEFVGYRFEFFIGFGYEWDLLFDIVWGRVSNFNGCVIVEEGGFVSFIFCFF